jgi:hypothetical protein
MRQAGRFAVLFITGMVWLNACSQTGGSGQVVTHERYYGSSPCDSLIRSMAGIPQGSACEFIKWEMTLERGDQDSACQVTLYYGESRPNTNGFKVSNKIEFSGTYHIRTGIQGNPNANFYHLKSGKGKGELWLLEMDKNIFLFTDSGGNFLMGNGGYSYVLNKTRE